MSKDLDVGHNKYCDQIKIVFNKTGIPEDKIEDFLNLML